MKRHKMQRSHSKKDFTRKAVSVHKVNSLNPMRGGIRL